jgi:hypothetical protein
LFDDTPIKEVVENRRERRRHGKAISECRESNGRFSREADDGREPTKAVQVSHGPNRRLQRACAHTSAALVEHLSGRLEN